MIEFNVSRKGDTDMAFDKNKYDDGWKKEHTTLISIRLNHNTDSDILSAIDKSGITMAQFVRNCIREYIANHRQDGE